MTFSPTGKHLNLNISPNYCCDDTCLTCSGPNNNNCLTCDNSYFLETNFTCVTVC